MVNLSFFSLVQSAISFCEMIICIYQDIWSVIKWQDLPNYHKSLIYWFSSILKENLILSFKMNPTTKLSWNTATNFKFIIKLYFPNYSPWNSWTKLLFHSLRSGAAGFTFQFANILIQINQINILINQNSLLKSPNHVVPAFPFFI